MGPNVAKRKAASQATVNVVEEVTGPSVEKNQKSTWTAKETDTLVAEFISRKVRPRLIVSLHSYKFRFVVSGNHYWCIELNKHQAGQI